jgi:hypothetical protein
MTSKVTKKKSINNGTPKKISFFDHVKSIRQVKDPNYYTNLSEDDKKSFNHFMILRALAMDDSIVEDIAQLYQIFDKIPSAQFYQLLIALVPKSTQYYPWIKTKVMKHNVKLLELVSDRFNISKYQANEYINILLKTPEGQTELVDTCKMFGLEDKEIEEMFESKKDE